MFRRQNILKISKYLFLTLVFLIPVNLGKHFEVYSSYVNGVVVDYLIPTMYVQDIIVFVLLILWFASGGLYRFVFSEDKFLERKEVIVSTLFIFSVFLSTLSSLRFLPSFYAWFRLFIYFLLFLYSLSEIHIEDEFFNILGIVSISVTLLSILGILQFFNKGSIFNNYLLFGEQPYTLSTPNITVKNLLGRAVVPSYGLFRHPNVFGGYLSLMLLWLIPFVRQRKVYLIPVVLGIISLFFTFSYISWASFLFGLFSHLILSRSVKNTYNKKQILSGIVVALGIFMLIIPVFRRGVYNDPSIYRRINFSKASYRMIKDRPLFGVGFNNSVVVMDFYNIDSNDISFVQPVHNIFLLIFSESGVFSFLLLCLLLILVVKKLVNSSYFYIFFISVLQIIILGSFDHYILTMHQTLLLFWLILGISLR
jgi:hypothetical protein